MLDKEVIQKIEEFVYKSPRSIQEISVHLDKNWRTVDRYVDEIIKEYGTIDKKIFREGTRGALKIVYWAALEKASSSVFQERLESEILNGRRREDFSAFDVFQYVDKKKKSVWMKESGGSWSEERLKKFSTLLKTAKKQILFFSGDLSFVQYKSKEVDIFKTLEELVKRGISIKVLSRVDIVGKKNIEKLLSLNFKHGKEIIEIKNAIQPVRATIIDDKVIEMKEIIAPSDEYNEKGKESLLIYTIKDPDWVKWLTRIFWKIFSSSIGSEKRLQEIEIIKK